MGLIDVDGEERPTGTIRDERLARSFIADLSPRIPLFSERILPTG